MISIHFLPSGERGRISISRCSLLSMTLLCVALIGVCSGQVAIPTSRSDNARSGANTSETMLTPSNVNKNQFGSIFNYPIDYQALAQPLYVPNVNINVNGQVSTHNVVYVATMADSVYAFDADSNAGSNANPLWWINFTDIDNNPANGPVPGLSTASGEYLPCSGGKTTGFTQEGIAGTPVIDTTTGTLYVIAKTMMNVNGTVTVYHYLHAIDITSGAEKYNGPVQITASSVANNGHLTTFSSLHQLNRPGLLLLNGVVYAGFGSNGCNDNNTGWLLAYDENTLQQVGSFNTSADLGLASIWQTGNGIAADEDGNIFVVTAESSSYNVPTGGQSYCNSVLELTNTIGQANSLSLVDYFTPDDVAYLNVHDLDLSAGGPVVLPDQNGPATHLVVAGGKTGTLFALNRDDLGWYSSNDGQLSAGQTNGQEIDGEVGHLFDSPAYWNGMLYYAADADEIKAFALTNTGSYPPVSTAPIMQTSREYVGSHSPSISANGNTNGILWVMSGGGLYAFDATNLEPLYNTNQSGVRDTLPKTAHFATQTIANGKVYVATLTTLQVYGLLQGLNLVTGANQTGPILTTLPQSIQVQVVDPYSGAPIQGVTVTFSDGGKKGTFSNPVGSSDPNGNVSTTYTFSKTAGAYTLTASSLEAASLSIPETATPGPATQMVIHAGNKQTGQAGSILPTQLSVATLDSYKNGVSGVTVTFVDESGLGTLNPSTAVSNNLGFAAVSYQLPNTDGTYKISATATASQCPTCKSQTFVETATGDAPANLGVVSGNNQTAPVNTQLPQPLVVQVTDQSGNPIAGVSVTFSAPSGTLSSASVTTNASGQASVNYTTGNSVGTVTITAAVDALNTQFTVNVTGDNLRR